MLKPLHPWHLAPRNEARTNESISENFCLDNHHSENTGNGIPPIGNQENGKGNISTKWKFKFFFKKKKSIMLIAMQQLPENLKSLTH